MNGICKVHPLFVPVQRLSHLVRAINLHVGQAEKLSESICDDRRVQFIDGFQDPSGFQQHRDGHVDGIVRSKQISGGLYLCRIVPP